MYKIFVSNVQSQLSGYTMALEKELTFTYEGYQYSPKYKAGLWDGMWHALKVPSLKFPTGLLPNVVGYFARNNIDFEIIDLRRIPNSCKKDISADMLGGITLRDYQLDAIKEAAEAKRGVLELPTGSGKTEIAAGIIIHLGLKTLFLVHTQDLLRQTAKRFTERLGQTIGMVGDGEFNTNPAVVVATVQSLSAYSHRDPEGFKNLINSFFVLFQDEAHHSSASTWYKIGMYAHSAYYRYGLSGTVLRRDMLSNMKMLSVFGAPIQRIRSKALMDKGYLSGINIELVSNPEQVSGYRWPDIYENGIVHSWSRNNTIAQIAAEEHKAGNKVLILIRIIEHGNEITDMLSARGVSSIFLTGKDSSEAREYAMIDFNETGNFVLIASPIFSEGVDIPEINTLIIAAGGKSEVLTIQRIGRGLRPKADGSKLKVYDFLDSSKYLCDHSAERVAIYKAEGFPCEKRKAKRII